MVRGLLVGGGTCLLMACSPQQEVLPPLELFSERVAIAVLDEHPPCAGDLAYLDERVAQSEMLSGFSGSETIDIYLGSGEGRCSDGAEGCYRPGQDVIFSPWFLIEHELGHAIARDVRFESRFWSEGFAEVASGTLTRKSDAETLTVEQFDDEFVFANYVTVGHFARYLVETRGWETYRAVLEEGSAAILGLSEEALAEEYEREAPAAYPPRPSCSYPVLRSDSDGAWSDSVSFSCEMPEATQFEHLGGSRTRGAAILRSVELEAGTYEMESIGGDGFILVGCLVEVLETLPEDPANGVVRNEVDHGTGELFSSGVLHRVSVDGGLYRVAMSSGTEAETTMELRIRRVDE